MNSNLSFVHLLGGLYVLWSCVVLAGLGIMLRNAWVFRSWSNDRRSVLYSMQVLLCGISSLCS